MSIKLIEVKKFKATTISAKILAATKTVQGFPVFGIYWLEFYGYYAGFVKHPKFKPNCDTDGTACLWDEKGRCKNRNRKDCDLQLA